MNVFLQQRLRWLLVVMMTLVPLVQITADAHVRVGKRVVGPVHLKSGETLILDWAGSVSLCPDGPRTCSFAPNSTVDVRLPVTNGTSGVVAAATTVVIGSGGLHIPHLLVRGGATVVLSSDTSSDEVSHPPSWTFDSVRLAGGTLEVVGKKAYATSKNLNFAPGKLNSSSATTKRSTIEIASGATFATTDHSSPLRVTGAAMVHLRHASSSFQVGSDLASENGARFLWTLGGNSAEPQKFMSQIAGNIYVEGNCVIAEGTTAVVQQDRNVPVKATAEIGKTVSSLISAVDFTGKFDNVVLGEQVKCAGATTSESWSSFSLLVSSRCLSQCAVHSTCRTEVVVPSAAGAGSDTTDTGSVGEASGSRDEDSDVMSFVVAVFVVMGVIVVVAAFGRRLHRAHRASAEGLSGISHPGIMLRRSPNPKQPTSGPDGRESDTVSLLI